MCQSKSKKTMDIPVFIADAKTNRFPGDIDE
jgi:hypothetical protein